MPSTIRPAGAVGPRHPVDTQAATLSLHKVLPAGTLISTVDTYRVNPPTTPPLVVDGVEVNVDPVEANGIVVPPGRGINFSPHGGVPGRDYLVEFEVTGSDSEDYGGAVVVEIRDGSEGLLDTLISAPAVPWGGRIVIYKGMAHKVDYGTAVVIPVPATLKDLSAFTFVQLSASLNGQAGFTITGTVSDPGGAAQAVTFELEPAQTNLELSENWLWWLVGVQGTDTAPVMNGWMTVRGFGA